MKIKPINMYYLSNILKRNKILHNFTRNMKSALYITGQKAQEMYVAIYPHVDFEKRLNDEKELIDNISRRNLVLKLNQHKSRYEFYQMIKEKKVILQTTLEEIRNSYASFIKEAEPKTDMINLLKLHKHVVSEELKSLKEYITPLEETVMIAILNLPNYLHKLTPEKDEIIHSRHEKPNVQSDNHMNIATKLKLIKLVEDWGCYLKSDAALFELAISNYFINNLIDLKFIQFQNADFARSVIIEGCGTNIVNNNDVLTLYEHNAKNEKFHELSRLHLTGSATTYAFMAYFAKHVISKSHFPLKYFCYGRSYNGNLRTNDNLFNLNQESVLNVFMASFDETTSWNNFEEIKDKIIKLYDDLGYHYRLVYLEASKLDKSESLRLSIQMYSNSLQEYVEVGYLSYYGSFVSERLLFTCLDKDQKSFPHLISGNILNVQKMLGCILENRNENESVLTEFLRKFLP